MNFMGKAWDRFRGSGDAAVTVPPMDGSLRPNTVLDDAGPGLFIHEPGNLTSDGKRIWFSSGPELHEYNPDDDSSKVVENYASRISCLASLNDGGLVVGLESGMITFWKGAMNGAVLKELNGVEIRCPVAMSVAADGAVILCLGSQQCGAEEWKHDLMSLHSSGSIWRINPADDDTKCLANGLAFPSGVVCLQDGSLAYSEAWRHRVVVLDSNGNRRVALAHIPGYPGEMRLDPLSGDLWMAIFAPRNQLVEFVLREKEYREEMMASVDPEHWIAPSYYPPRSYMEPLQGGALKQLGEMKAWAPSRSYGLVVRLNGDIQPVQSFHSRADGLRHGVVSCLPMRDNVLIASRGNNEVFKLKAGSIAP